MKILLSMIILIVGFSSFAQINQRTRVQREQYSKVSTLHLKEPGVPLSLQRSYLYNRKMMTRAGVESNLKQTSTAIQKAFDYYGATPRTDHSGFLLLGYSFPTSQQIIVNNREDESIRFFPANIKD